MGGRFMQTRLIHGEPLLLTDESAVRKREDIALMRLHSG